MLSPSAAKRPRSLRSKDLTLYLLALPGMLFFLIFSYAPMIGIVVAFKNVDISAGVLQSHGMDWRIFASFSNRGQQARSFSIPCSSMCSFSWQRRVLRS